MGPPACPLPEKRDDCETVCCAGTVSAGSKYLTGDNPPSWDVTLLGRQSRMATTADKFGNLGQEQEEMQDVSQAPAQKVDATREKLIWQMSR